MCTMSFSTSNAFFFSAHICICYTAVPWQPNSPLLPAFFFSALLNGRSLAAKLCTSACILLQCYVIRQVPGSQTLDFCLHSSSVLCHTAGPWQPNSPLCLHSSSVVLYLFIPATHKFFDACSEERVWLLFNPLMN